MVVNENVSFSIFKIFGAPVLVSSAFVFVFVYFGFKFEPLEACLISISYLVLLLVHEVGHAFFVRKYKHELINIEIFPLHGVCRFSCEADYKPEMLIHCGGLIAQALLFCLWYVFIELAETFGWWELYYFLKPVTMVLLWFNVATFILNMIPIPGLDGFHIFFSFFWKPLIGRKSHSKSKAKNDKESVEEIVREAIDKAKRGP